MKKKMVLIGGLYMERNIKCKPNNLCMIENVYDKAVLFPHKDSWMSNRI